MNELDIGVCNRVIYLSIYLFTSFSGHRPAQSECARTGLRSHSWCHPYPIPQPVKVGHTFRVSDPYSFRIVMWVLLRPTRTNQWKCFEMGPTVLRSHNLSSIKKELLWWLTPTQCHRKHQLLPSIVWLTRTITFNPLYKYAVLFWTFN